MKSKMHLKIINYLTWPKLWKDFWNYEMHAGQKYEMNELHNLHRERCSNNCFWEPFSSLFFIFTILSFLFKFIIFIVTQI